MTCVWVVEFLTAEREFGTLNLAACAVKVLAQTVALRVVQTLRMRARRGKVESITRTKGVCVWEIRAGWAPLTG